MTEVLLALNGGKGPDILALAEVENTRAAELLKDALNAKLEDPAFHYKHVLMREVKVGRHIAPAVLSRLPVKADRTKQLGAKKQRILRTHIVLNGQELIVIAAHWTSRLKGGEQARAEYADDIYGEFKAMYLSNPKVDVLICGDFNDDPEDPSVLEHLKATGNLDAVRQGGDEPLLFNLMAGKDSQQFGTHYFDEKRTWHLFDQIVVSPGMLDGHGWSCDPQSVATVKSVTGPGGQRISLVDPTGQAGRPWNFGSPRTAPTRRGYSDHFPVTVTLKLHGEAQVAGR
jgi:endonuclease/exonuclease/phosphatase family metal-dependent hydrolase